MKFTIRLERTVELIVEAPNPRAAEEAAAECMADFTCWEPAEETYISEYKGPYPADFTVDENGNEVAESEG